MNEAIAWPSPWDIATKDAEHLDHKYQFSVNGYFTNESFKLCLCSRLWITGKIKSNSIESNHCNQRLSTCSATSFATSSATHSGDYRDIVNVECVIFAYVTSYSSWPFNCCLPSFRYWTNILIAHILQNAICSHGCRPWPMVYIPGYGPGDHWSGLCQVGMTVTDPLKIWIQIQYQVPTIARDGAFWKYKWNTLWQPYMVDMCLS